MTNPLVDPIRICRNLTMNNALARYWRDAVDAVCDEAESLRVENYEASLREEGLARIIQDQADKLAEVQALVDDNTVTLRRWIDGSRLIDVDTLERVLAA